MNKTILFKKTFNLNDVEFEYKNMVLLKISKDGKLWVPISDLFLNKVKVDTFTWAIYDETKKYVAVLGDKKVDITGKELITALKEEPKKDEVTVEEILKVW